MSVGVNKSSDRPARRGPTKVYVETPEGIADPITVADPANYRELFEKFSTAIALWVMPSGIREPFRVPFHRNPRTATATKRPRSKC